jgi:predicted kinase
MLARSLAPGLEPAPGAIVLRSDVERKAMAGLAESERLPAAAYTAENAARVYAVLVNKAQRAIAAGHSPIVDAVFARSEERNALPAVAFARGVEFRGIFLIADVATRVDRIGARRGDASDADIAVARAQESYAVGQNDWLMCDVSNTPQVTLDRARKLLEPGDM